MASNTFTFFGKWLKSARERAGLTAYRLATLSGVPRSLISAFELGQRSATDEMLRRLVAPLDVPYEDAKLEIVDDAFSASDLRAVARWLTDEDRKRDTRSVAGFWTGLGLNRLELEAARLLKAAGYDQCPAPEGSQDAAMLYVQRKGHTYLVQFKSTDGPLNQEAVLEVVETWGKSRAGGALWVVPAGLTASALMLADKNGIRVFDGKALAALQRSTQRWLDPVPSGSKSRSGAEKNRKGG